MGFLDNVTLPNQTSPGTQKTGFLANVSMPTAEDLKINALQQQANQASQQAQQAGSTMGIIKQTGSDIWNTIKGIGTGIYNQYANPSDTIKQTEQIFQNPKNPLVNPVTQFATKAIIRTFGPIVEGAANDIATSINIGTANPQLLNKALVGKVSGPLTLNAQGGVNTIQMTPQEKQDLLLVQRSPLQTIGDFGQVVMAAYAPEKLLNVKGTGLASQIGNVFSSGAQIGSSFGVAQSLSSGSKDPKEIAKIMVQSTLGGVGLSLLTGGPQVLLGEIGRLKTEVKSPAVKDALDVVEEEVKSRTEGTGQTQEAKTTPFLKQVELPQKPLAQEAEPGQVPSTRGEDVLNAAVQKNIMDETGELPTHEQMSVNAEDIKAREAINQNPSGALASVLDTTKTNDPYIESIYKNLETKAIQEGDVETLRKLSQSNVPTEAGQRLKLLDSNNPDNPVKIMRDINKTMENNAGGTEKVEGFKKMVQTEGNQTLLPKEELSWERFINKIIC
jgi:hypothetical protein